MIPRQPKTVFYTGEDRLYIQEEEINIPDLPSEIKQAMRNFNAKLKSYEESEDEETNEKLFLELQQDDVEIADNILTWWEDFNSEDDEEQEFEQEEEEEESKPVEVNSKTPAQPKVEVPAQPKVEVPAQPKVEVPVQPKVEESVEQKVRNLIKNNVISKSDLENVLGREADYPTQIVGNLKLRKQYLKPFYEVN